MSLWLLPNQTASNSAPAGARQISLLCGCAGPEVSSPTAKPLDGSSSSVLKTSASERSFRNPGEEAQAAEYARQVSTSSAAVCSAYNRSHRGFKAPRVSVSQSYTEHQRVCWGHTERWVVAPLQERTIQKKLQQIDALQRRAADVLLDSQQLAKLALRPTLTAALQALQVTQHRLTVNPPPKHWRQDDQANLSRKRSLGRRTFAATPTVPRGSSLAWNLSQRGQV